MKNNLYVTFDIIRQEIGNSTGFHEKNLLCFLDTVEADLSAETEEAVIMGLEDKINALSGEMEDHLRDKISKNHLIH